MKLAAEWTNDCQGKKDYDGEILSISTRYWPRGGGFWVMNNEGPGRVSIQENDARPEIKPSAHSSLIVRHDGDNYSTLAEAEFEADTEGEVKAAVEAWAQVMMDKAVEALSNAFGGLKRKD